MMSPTRSTFMVLTAVGLAAAATAATVTFQPAAVTLAGQTPQNVTVRVGGVTPGTALGFASFYLAWDQSALAVSVVNWDETVLDVPGVATAMDGGRNVSAARVHATGGVAADQALLTLKLTARAGKTGDFSLRLKPHNLTQLQGLTGQALKVNQWPVLSVTIGTGGAAAALAGLAVSQGGGGFVTLSYTLLQDAVVQIGILNLAGRRVRGLGPGRAEPAGRGSQTWDLTADTGAAVPAGMYLAVVEALGDDGGRHQVTQPFPVRR